MNERFKIWYIPQIPMPAFEREYGNFDTAREVLDAIIGLSIFEFEHRVKPDYADMAGIQRWTEEGWEDVEEDEWEL